MPNAGQRIKKADHTEAVHAVLKRAKRPLSAYEVITMLRGRADLAPPTAYRILNRLIAEGHAHKVQSLNAFMACNHEHHQEDAAFAICDACGSVTEFKLPKLNSMLERWSRDEDFALHAAAVELHGTCVACQVEPVRPVG